MMSKVRPNLLSSSSFHCTSNGGRRGNHDQVDASPQQEFADDQPGLDRFAEADITQIRSQDLGAIGRTAPDLGPGVVLDDARPDLGVPDDLDLLALRVVRDAGEAQGSEDRLAIVHRLDQPRPATHFYKTGLVEST